MSDNPFTPLSGQEKPVKEEKQPMLRPPRVRGYRWPGDTPPRPPANAGNPFKEEAGQHLKALQERLTKGK